MPSRSASASARAAFLFNPPIGPPRGDPRFEALVREIGLDASWRDTGTVPGYRRARG